MALPSPSFIAGLLVLLYLSTFIVFALIRIVTGVSIQRLGLSSLRRIAFTPRDGLKLEIRGLGLQLHRPTFAQPTWVSLVVTELKVTIDLVTLKSQKRPSNHEEANGHAGHSPSDGKAKRGKKNSWTRLLEVKNRIKNLHGSLAWIKLFDFVAHKSTIVVNGVGTVQIGSFIISLDTRRATVDRARIFNHSRNRNDKHNPAEWTVDVRSVLFTPEGAGSNEILDHGQLKIHGQLRPDVKGLRDISLAVKLGRLYIPYDDFAQSTVVARSTVKSTKLEHGDTEPTDAHVEDVSTNSNPDAVEVLRDVTDARGFISSLLRGIHEVSFAASFVGLSKRVESVRPAGSPVYLNMALKEFGLDLYRLDPMTPAHSMYFERSDVAHQVLVSAISISVGVEDGLDHPERLLYIPMTTATIKTTLPAKILQYAAREESHDRNTNVLFANLVITSPSIDCDPRHFPLVIAMLEARSRRQSKPKSSRPAFIQDLLPKMTLRLSMHEPVIRVALPTSTPKSTRYLDFDLLISAISSVSLDIDASHELTAEGNSQYFLTSALRMATHRLYYQNALKEKHNLMLTDSIELKTRLMSYPELSVSSTASVNVFTVFLVRPEVFKGINQIARQLRSDVSADKLSKPKTSESKNPLRTIPPWFKEFSFDAKDFNIEVAALDEKLSSQPRGFALHLDLFSIEYKLRKDQVSHHPKQRRKASGLSTSDFDPSFNPLAPPPSKRAAADGTDGRRLAVHLKGFEGFIIEATNMWEQEPFVQLPRAEVAFTTTSDGYGPILHINSLIKGIYLQYSLFRHYCLGVAIVTLRRTFSRHNASDSEAQGANNADAPQQPPQQPSQRHKDADAGGSDFLVVDAKVNFIQIKAAFPADPKLMLHIHELEAAKHRWTTPHAKAFIARLLVDSYALPGHWNKLIAIKSPRVDLREARRKPLNGTGDASAQMERSIDVSTEAIRIGVPHGLVVHAIFDNIVNTLKTAQQLHHRFITDTNEYILAKHPEGPKHVPRVTVRSHVFLFEIEDGAFEWKLGVIFRTGLVEQKQRLARDEAFRLKAQELEKARNGRSRTPRTTNTERDASQADSSDDEESGRPWTSNDNKHDSHRTSSQAHRRKRPGLNMRYDTEGTCAFTSESKVSVNQAEEKLKRYNSQSWKKRIDRAMSQQVGAVADMRSILWGMDTLPDNPSHEKILQMPSRPALMSILMSDLNIIIDKPSFPLDKLPDFMHDVGKGLPKDTKFSLLIPLHASFEIGEARVSLRDYPLPLLHIPPIKPGQAPRLPSWSLKSNFVIGEEFRDFESIRDLKITVVPPDKLEPSKPGGSFAIDVRRTVAPTKMYSDIKWDINTARETRFTWGTSYQPAIQDMMQVIESFTKPQIDPSPRVGFWDKLRLNFHSRICIDWKGGGDVHLMLKGSKDPYVVTGHGAGFVMVWRNNVQCNIWKDADPKNFLTVDSGDYILAIPDFSSQARSSPELIVPQAQGSRSLASSKESQKFKKVVMKLSGKVRWNLGLVFERTTTDGKKSFDFSPHYDVTLKNPVHVKSIENEPEYDAFRGFRSNHIHMSIGISAPHGRDWNVRDAPPSSNYNSIHLSPRFFTHFFSWWSMFSGVMSLPVHQGPLWPGVEKSGKKFGRHIATIKYSLLFSPLFVSHVYKHKEAEEFSRSDSKTHATGLKARLDSFMLDLHQRREEFMSEVKGQDKMMKTSAMKINQTLLDLVSADIRAVSAVINVPDIDSILHVSNAKLAEYEEIKRKVDLSDFEIPDNDFSWIDVDDFVEVDWTLPIDSDPQVQILPLAQAPRFTYRRQTDHHDTISGDPNRTSPFGYEPTHGCIMKTQDDSRQIQIDIIKIRLKKLDDMKEKHDRNMGEHELNLHRETGDKSALEHQLFELKEHSAILEHKRAFLKKMIADLKMRIKNHDLRVIAQPEELDENARISEMSDEHDTRDGYEDSNEHEDNPNPLPLAEQISDFNNRFVVHNMKMKWNNSLRNIMLRYFHQVSQRRGFVYYTTRRAVKFILDIVDEQEQHRAGAAATASASGQEGSISESVETPMSNEDDVEVQDRIEQLLKDGKMFVDADDPDHADHRNNSRVGDDVHQDVAQDFAAMNTYHLRLVAPQIQLQSEKNPRSAVILTTRGVRLKVIQIMDKDRMSDDVSGLVQRRFSMDFDNMQFFVTNKETFALDHLHMYSDSRYGAPEGSFWPPWVPIEVMFDFSVPSLGFKRVVQRTSASLRYDKYNKLRLKYNDNISEGKDGDKGSANNSERRMDHLWVDFPQLRAICDSDEYFTMYTIVVDLLMWSEPLEKVRNERLEKIMLAADFSDLRGAPEMVITLQERIRQLEEIKTHFHINEKYLDRKGWGDRVALEQDLANCEDELFFIMKAITTSQTKSDDRGEGSQTTGLLKWYLSAQEIVWHLTKEGDEPLGEFQLGNAFFERTDNSDGSNHNFVEIDKIRGLCLLPNAIYPEMLSPFMDGAKDTVDESSISMLRVKWHMLEAIAGIPIVDHFEINLFPLKIQLEYETGKKLFEYIFPGKSQENGQKSADSPFMVRRQPVPDNDKDDELEYQRRREKALQATLSQKSQGITGAGSLESRLHPTLILPDSDGRPYTSPSSKNKGLGVSIGDARPSSLLSVRSASRSPSTSSRKERASIDTTNTQRGRNVTRTDTGDSSAPSRKSRFSLAKSSNRSNSSESRNTQNKRYDELSQMMNRASNYMTLAYAKIPSVVLCLSYKGRGKRNVEDVHNLVFRMPTLEYRNKTWSNLDLALALKKDVIHALINHTGTIISNKFSHRRPGQQQVSRLRELASTSVVLSSSSDLTSVPGTRHSFAPSTSSALAWSSAAAASTAPAGNTVSNGASNGVRRSETTETEADPLISEEQAQRTYTNSLLSPSATRNGAHGDESGLGASSRPGTSRSTVGSTDGAMPTTPERSRNGDGTGSVRQTLQRHLSGFKEKALSKLEGSDDNGSTTEGATHNGDDGEREKDSIGRRGTIRRIFKKAAGASP